MLNTFIKNQGITKTLIHNNNKNYISEINWDADYDGEIAKISLNINDNGNNEHYKVKMDNDEISELLNIPSINMPIDKRLSNDFLGRNPKKFEDHDMVVIYKIPKKNRKKIRFVDPMDPINTINPDEIMDTLEHIKMPREQKQIYTHISSPLPSESLLFPLQIYNKSKTHRRRRRRHHTSHLRKHRKTKSHKNTYNHNYSRRTF